MDWDEADVPSHVIYRQVRENVIGFLTDRPDVAGRRVPACPEWTVRDLVNHLVDICVMVTRRLSGRPPGLEAGGPSAAPGGAPDLARLLADWAEAGERLDRLAAEVAHPRGHALALDAFTHELDLRRAVELPPPAGHPGYPSMLGVVVGGFSGAVLARDLPPLRIELPGAHWIAGRTGPPPAATMRAPGPHDLFRTLTGRRTHAQIKTLSWSVDPAPWLPAFTWGSFSPPARPAEEPVAG